VNEESIKLAFSKVKSDIEVLQNEILSSKQAIQEGKETIESLKSKISELKEILLELKSQFSTGNEGVQSINHSTINQSLTEHSEEWTEHSEKQAKHSEEWTEHSKDLRNSSQSIMQHPLRSSTFSKVRELNEALSKTFQSLTNQEFKVFLTIYQLEDERGRATYGDLALKTSLTSGCIRGYVSSLILKGAPIVKTRQKNRQASLTIDNSFRSLGLKEKLINLYYQQDPQQTTLFAVK